MEFGEGIAGVTDKPETLGSNVASGGGRGTDFVRPVSPVRLAGLESEQEKLVGVEEQLLSEQRSGNEIAVVTAWEEEKRTWITAISTCVTLFIVLATFVITTVLLSQNLTVEDKVDRVEAVLLTQSVFLRALLITERNMKQRDLVMKDQTAFLIGLQCASLQMMAQTDSKTVSSLLQVCSEMEVAITDEINAGIHDLETGGGAEEGECLSGADGDISVGEDYCVDPFPLVRDSLSETGLLPETLEESSEVELLSGDNSDFPGSSMGDDSESGFDVPVYVSNPLLGPFYQSGPYVYGASDSEPMTGIFISYTYSTKRNIDYVNIALGGGGSGITPENTYPNDGVLFVDLNVRNSHARSSPRETFGKITAVLESSVFDGLGRLFADRETVVVSGKSAIAGWLIGNGLDSVQSLPTLTRDVIAAGTEDAVSDTSLVSPDHVLPYVEESTGKRFFLFGARDTVDPNDPGTLFCDTAEDTPLTCGGFFTVDRDALWESSPNLAISRRTPYGLNNGLLQSTPGSFVTTRGRSVIMTTTSISYLFSSQDPCYFAHFFISHVLNRSDLVGPSPDYDYDLEEINENVEFSARVSVYQYENLLLLFNLSSRWLDVGDILYNTELEIPGNPPVVPDRNQINRPNLDVNLAWKYATGYAPSSLSSVGEGMLNGVDIYYGVDFFTGGIFTVSPVDSTGNSAQSQEKYPDIIPWRLVYVAWLPYITVGGTRYDRPPLNGFFPEIDDGDTEIPVEDPFGIIQMLPYPSDLKISKGGRYVFVAATGLGQVVVYRRPKQDGLELEYCTSVQTTIGQYNRTRFPSIEHPKNPGVPLYSGPSRLIVDRNDRFLYVVTGSDIDDCVYPEAGDFGGVVVRYLIGSGCDDFTLVLDPAFLVTALDLPSHLVSGTLDGTTSGFETLSLSVRDRPPRFGDVSFI